MSELLLDRSSSAYPETPPRKRRSGKAMLLFIAIWVVLIAAGITGAVVYSNHMKQQITAEIEAQTASQIAALQNDYEARLKEMEEGYQADLAELQSKVDALNELLTFTKDNADTKTDNSNKLYTQLNEVKKQLNALQKNLDVLK